MAITESDQNVIREMFVEAAKDVLKGEHEIIRQMVQPMTMALLDFEARMSTLEGQVAQMIRIEKFEARLKALEEAVGH